MARKNRYTKVGMMRGLIDAVYDSAPQPTQAPSMNFGMSKADIDSIYDGAIANQQNQAQEIPKLEDNTVNAVQNTPATPASTGNQTIADELERMRKVKAENKPRSESEQRAIDTYLADLERASQPGYKPDFNAEIDRMKALDSDSTVNWSEGEKKAREDYLTSLQGVVAEEQRKQTEERARQAYANRTVKSREKAAEKAAEITEKPVKEQKQTATKYSGYAKEELANRKDNVRAEIGKTQERAKNIQRDISAKELNKWAKEQPLAEAASRGQTVDPVYKQEQLYGDLSPEAKEKVDKLNDKLSTLTKPEDQFQADRVKKKINKVYQTEISNAENDNEFVQKALDPNYVLTKDEEKRAKNIIKDYEKTNSANENAYVTLAPTDEYPDGRMVPAYTVDENGNYDPTRERSAEEKQREQDIYKLKNKINNSETALYSAGTIIPGVSAFNAVLENKDPEYKRMMENMKAQNPFAYRAGQVGGFAIGAGMSGAGRAALEGTKYVNALDKLAKSGGVAKEIFAEALKDMPVDTFLDIIPTLISDVASDKSAGEVALNTFLNTGLNFGMNAAIPALTNIGGMRSAKNVANSIGDNANLADDVAEEALNPLEMAAKNADIENAIANQEQAVENLQNLKQQISEIPEAPIEQTVKNVPETPVKPIEYDTKKIADKEINDGINTLANMYKRNGEEELIGSYRAALNEYAQTGSAESLQKARSIAEELDGRFAGREYTTKKGRIHGFDSGYQGRFTDFAEMLEYRRNMAQPVRDTIIERAPELNDKIDNLFGRFGYTEDQAQLVSNLKKTINDIANGDTSEDTLTRFVDELSRVELSYRNAEEYVSTFKGKAKRNPFDMSEANEIMEDTFDIAKKNQANAPVPEAVEQGAKNAALNASDDTARLTVEPTSNNIANGNDNIPPKSMNVDLSEGEEAERGLAKHLRSQVDVRVATPMKVEGVPDEVANDFVENLDMYKVLKNKDTKDLADNIYNSGEAPIEINGKEYTGNVETKFRSLLSEKNPASLPLGHQIAKDYSAAGNYEMASQIYRDMGQALTESGQFSQAAIINMIKDDPLTAMHYAQKEIDAMNEQGAKRFKKKWKDFAFTDEEIEAFNNINPGDEKAIKELYERIGARLGKEYPTTMLDKLLEGRKVAMLLNPRTWSRNIVANVPTLAMRWVSDRVEGLGQSVVHLIDPTFEKTQAITGGGREGRKLASQFTKTDAYEKLIKGTQGKYEVPELKNSLMNNVQTYKGTGLERWLDRMIGNGFNKAAEKLGKDIRIDGGIQALNKALYGKEGVQSVLETLRNTTYKALDLGDSPFVKENFVSRLGSYINAQGIKNLEDIPDEAIQTAWEEAMKATYKDNSWAVQMLKGLRNASMEKIPGIGRPLAQAVIPFVQAPGNIAARMIDYSPIRGTKGVADIISGAVKKDHNAIRRGIEEFSKGATGTGMVLLGMKLRESGILTGDYSENKQQREMQKRDGFKPWALKVGDKYFTYNWAQPFGENLIIGTLLQEAIEKSDQYDSDILRYFGVEGSKAGKVVGATWKGTKAAVNSWFNESPLKGLQELMSGGGYGKDDIAQNLADTGIGDFAGALVPAAVNAYTKTQDPVKRNTYDPSNTFATFLNQQQAKLPGASEKLPALYDTWGEEQKYANSKGESAFQRFLYPGEYGVQEDDPIDIEINRLFDSPQGKSYDDRGFETTDNTLAGDEGVFPTKAPTSVSGRKLTNEEVSAYQEDMGKRSRRIVEAFMNSKLYQDMNDEQRIDALKNIYATSKAITERDLFNKPISDTYKKRVEAFDNYKAYDKRGFEKSREDSSIEGVLKSFEASKLINDAGVKSNTKIAEEITEAVKAGNYEKAEDLSQSVPTLESLGLGDVHPAVYAKAKRKFPDISVEDFADMYKKIDGADGTKPNYAIAQTELIPYLNMYYKPTGTEEEQKKIKDDALKVWYTFQKDDVKHIPVYEGGKWVSKKK